MRHRRLHLRVLLLQLEEQRGILNLHKVIDVLESRLHQCHLALHRIVAEGDRLPHSVLWTGDEVAGEELDELVLDVLDEVQLCATVTVHDEHSQERVRLLDAGVHHLDQNVRVISKLDHKLLVLLHVAEAVLVDDVGIVEEQIVLTSQLDFDVLQITGVCSLYFGQWLGTYEL